MFTCKTDITPSIFSDIYRLKPINKDLQRFTGILSKPYYQGKCFEFIISFRNLIYGIRFSPKNPQ